MSESTALDRIAAECEYIVTHARKGSPHALGMYDLAVRLLGIIHAE